MSWGGCTRPWGDWTGYDSLRSGICHGPRIGHWRGMGKLPVCQALLRTETPQDLDGDPGVFDVSAGEPKRTCRASRPCGLRILQCTPHAGNRLSGMFDCGNPLHNGASFGSRNHEHCPELVACVSNPCISGRSREANTPGIDTPVPASFQPLHLGAVLGSELSAARRRGRGGVSNPCISGRSVGSPILAGRR